MFRQKFLLISWKVQINLEFMLLKFKVYVFIMYLLKLYEVYTIYKDIQQETAAILPYHLELPLCPKGFT